MVYSPYGKTEPQGTAVHYLTQNLTAFYLLGAFLCLERALYSRGYEHHTSILILRNDMSSSPKKDIVLSTVHLIRPTAGILQGFSISESLP